MLAFVAHPIATPRPLRERTNGRRNRIGGDRCAAHPTVQQARHTLLRVDAPRGAREEHRAPPDAPARGSIDVGERCCPTDVNQHDIVTRMVGSLDQFEHAVAVGRGEVGAQGHETHAALAGHAHDSVCVHRDLHASPAVLR